MNLKRNKGKSDSHLDNDLKDLLDKSELLIRKIHREVFHSTSLVADMGLHEQIHEILGKGTSNLDHSYVPKIYY